MTDHRYDDLYNEIADLRASLATVTAERDSFKKQWHVAHDSHELALKRETATERKLSALTAERGRLREALNVPIALAALFEATLPSERSRAWMAGVQTSVDRVTKAATHGIIDRSLLHEIAADLRVLQPPDEFASIS